jgi:hypothetical protein
VQKLFILLFLFFSFTINAQIIVKGIVVDLETKKTINVVRIENVATHQGNATNAQGEFEIEGKEGDYMVFSCIGYKNKIVRITPEMNNLLQKIYLEFKEVNLKGVTIKKGLTAYQKDSANRASLYKGAFEYEQTKSVMSPITSVYQAFSKKHKQIRHFQGQIKNMEQQKFIDTRYTTELVKGLTKINDEKLNEFIQAYPMEYDFARAASDLEIKMWIKYNYQDFLKKGK